MDCADEVADRSKIDVAAVRGGRGRAGDRLALAAAQREHGQAAVVEREVRRPETDAGLDADERPGLLIAGGGSPVVDRVRQVSLSAEVGPVTSSSFEGVELVEPNRPPRRRVGCGNTLERPTSADRPHPAVALGSVCDHPDERLQAVRDEVPLAPHPDVAQPVGEQPVLELIPGELIRGTGHDRLLRLEAASPDLVRCDSATRCARRAWSHALAIDADGPRSDAGRTHLALVDCLLLLVRSSLPFSECQTLGIGGAQAVHPGHSTRPCLPLGSRLRS
jgi:hypothetical protein